MFEVLGATYLRILKNMTGYKMGFGGSPVDLLVADSTARPRPLQAAHIF